MQAYNAMIAVLEGVKTQKKGQPLKQAVLNVGSFKFLQEPVQMNQYGDVDSSQYMTRITDGAFLTIDVLK